MEKCGNSVVDLEIYMHIKRYSAHENFDWGHIQVVIDFILWDVA